MKRIEKWLWFCVGLFLAAFLAIIPVLWILSDSGNNFEKGASAYRSGDHATAFTEFASSAKAGNSRAQFILGWMYHDGTGVPKNYRLAYMWYNLAAAQGHEEAKEYRDKMTKIMTRGQIAKAQEMSQKCLANNYKNCK